MPPLRSTWHRNFAEGPELPRRANWQVGRAQHRTLRCGSRNLDPQARQPQCSKRRRALDSRATCRVSDAATPDIEDVVVMPVRRRIPNFPRLLAGDCSADVVIVPGGVTTDISDGRVRPFGATPVSRRAFLARPPSTSSAFACSAIVTAFAFAAISAAFSSACIAARYVPWLSSYLGLAGRNLASAASAAFSTRSCDTAACAESPPADEKGVDVVTPFCSSIKSETKGAGAAGVKTYIPPTWLTRTDVATTSASAMGSADPSKGRR